MDTLSSSISTFSTPRAKLHPISNNHLHHFNTLHSHLIPSPKPTTSKLLNKTTPLNFTNHPPLIDPSQTPSISKQRPSEPHQKASTGYAVALLDAARCHNTLPAVDRDVKRLSRWLRNHQLSTVFADHQATTPAMGPCVKGEILKEVSRKGKFDKHLVKLVNLLIKKSKVDILGEVLVEFRKIYDQLVDGKRSQVVMVSPEVKMEKSQLLGIAKSVQKLTGAEKVSVRQLVDKRLPSFAV